MTKKGGDQVPDKGKQLQDAVMKQLFRSIDRISTELEVSKQDVCAEFVHAATVLFRETKAVERIAGRERKRGSQDPRGT